MREEILRLENVTQIEDGVTLLDDFNLHIFKGEIMGLLCLNDFGKDSLINLICRNVPVYYGRIYFNEVLINNYEHSNMRRNKVAVIEKDSSLVEDLTVADNIFVLRSGFKKYIISEKTLNAQLKLFTEEMGVEIDGKSPVSKLGSFEKCIVELIKAVIGGVRLILVKDISNYISVTDLARFQEILKYCCSKGISILYICNHHEDAFKICDRVSLMENGKLLKVFNTNEFRNENMKPYIIEFDNIVAKSCNDREGLLKFRNVHTGKLKGMSFTIEKGECAVLLDVNNTVLTDMVKVMNRELVPLCGDIRLENKNFLAADFSNELGSAIGFINEQPIKSMVFREMSYIDNLCFMVDQKTRVRRYTRRIRDSVIREYEPLIGADIYAGDVTALSAVSLYNLVYYRIHLLNPKIVFCIQPFYDADMYLRKHIVSLLNQLKQKGITVVILAVSLEDSLVVADRLVILENGKFLKEYDRSAFHHIAPSIIRKTI